MLELLVVILIAIVKTIANKVAQIKEEKAIEAKETLRIENACKRAAARQARVIAEYGCEFGEEEDEKEELEEKEAKMKSFSDFRKEREEKRAALVLEIKTAELNEVVEKKIEIAVKINKITDIKRLERLQRSYKFNAEKEKRILAELAAL